MQAIFREVEFREFSYELDPEAIVDMHRSAEVLEGSWFDDSETCKVHTKAVVRTPGSTWSLAYKTLVFGHADLTRLDDDQAVIPFWRIHNDYNHPTVIRKMLDGLKAAAKQRKYSSLVLFSDLETVKENMMMIGITPDRQYKYINVGEAFEAEVLPYTRILIRPDETSNTGFVPFMGPPFSPAYVMNRAHTGADYGIFHYTKPAIFEIEFKSDIYVGCHDGREWHVFKKGDFKADPDAIKPILATLLDIKRGQILLSEKVLEISEMTPVNGGEYYDFYIEI